MSQQLHFWSVRADQIVAAKNHQGVEYTTTQHIRNGVIAPTAEDAIAKVREQFPQCRIWTVAHQGKVTIS